MSTSTPGVPTAESTQATASACGGQGGPLDTLYLPNVAKTLGGPEGWETPFIIQNVGGSTASIELSFFRFSTGELVTCERMDGLAPGMSYAHQPNKDLGLPDNTQFSVVARAYGSLIDGVVNETAGSGDRFESSSYAGVHGGVTRVLLPNIVRRFFGWATRFVIQNLGANATTATASFLSFDGTKTAIITRAIGPGRSAAIDPNVEQALVDGTQYAVTVTASEPIAVRVGTQNDEPGVAHPVVHATIGSMYAGADAFGPYAVKNVAGIGRGYSTIVLQNTATGPADMTLAFTPLGGGATTTFRRSAVPPGGAWAFDPRFVNGGAVPTMCGATVSTGCLADGEYSFAAHGSTNSAASAIAVTVNVVGETTLMGYSADGNTSPYYSFPNVTRTLGGPNGWTTPIIIQSPADTGATSLELDWFRFSDGTLAAIQTVAIPQGAAVRVDPRTVLGLCDDTQYSVFLKASGGRGYGVAGIVTELNYVGGDGAMAYEGFGSFTPPWPGPGGTVVSRPCGR